MNTAEPVVVVAHWQPTDASLHTVLDTSRFFARIGPRGGNDD